MRSGPPMIPSDEIEGIYSVSGCEEIIDGFELRVRRALRGAGWSESVAEDASIQIVVWHVTRAVKVWQEQEPS